MAFYFQILYILVGCVDPGYAVAFLMKPIATFLILDKDDDHQADGHAEGQSENIYKRKALISQQ
jgi:hypothetical protein